MADPKGFLKNGREVASRREVAERVHDWGEVYPDGIGRALLPIITTQAGRCMDCGIPFCHQGCPLGNIIPEWNDLVWRGDWDGAMDRLHATNNFPEFTGRICPAPCESACVLGINQDPVTIKNIEVTIAEEAFGRDLVTPQVPARLTGNTVAVVGSGPAGLAAAQQLTRAGHTVAVYERDDAIGGLLRYGVTDFKLEKSVIDRRIDQMVHEGTRFRPGVEIGRDITWAQLRARYDAVVVATGENVVIIGGGDTGSDCLGTALRQRAASVTTLAIGKHPPLERPPHQPWPMDPTVFEVSSSHEEGGERDYLASTVAFEGTDGRLTGLRVATTEYLPDGRRVPTPGTERVIPADLVLIAMGFTGAETDEIAAQTGAQVT